ncbi:hypothetical protein [Opitutus terrae]|uniref:hypothetical protein n=1 Tax=Opitutus terrae TaxID=107709 RepID=UPI0011D113A2|nr:hypothetical protein [Opitutus terrae]
MALLLLSFALRAQHLTGSYGVAHSPDLGRSSYTWQLDYRQNFAQQLAWSAAWINEGHFPGHHRDGVTGQLWWRTAFLDGRLVLALGGGPYHFFDTQNQPGGDSIISRGWAPIGSVSLNYHPVARWFLRATANTIRPKGDDVTMNTFALGVGYRLWDEPKAIGKTERDPEVAVRRSLDHELTLYGGRTIVNASVGEGATAVSLEYRRHLTPAIDWTLSWLNEGDPEAVRRQGLTTQLWLGRRFWNERLVLGFGGGIYYAVDRERADPPADDPENLMPIVSPTIGYRFGERWIARFVWHRAISDYHRDSDVFLAGIGRRW